MLRGDFQGTYQPADEAILDSMGLALLVVDDRCRIMRLNSPAAGLLGLDGQQVVGRHCAEVLEASPCDTHCPVRRALQTAATCRFGTVTIQVRDQRLLTVEATASPLLSPAGETVGAVLLLRDVTDDPGQVRLFGSHIFVSQTEAMRRIFEALPRLAGSAAPLLISGARGSGRAALAETVHGLANLGQARALVRLDCSDRQPDPLTGSTGPLDRASGGTLLLENLCDATLPLQQTLLDWLEHGGEREELRLISTATDRLQEMLRAGAFRKDLFYRLNVLQVALPDLQQRVEDIPLIVEQFIEQMNLRRNKQVQGLAPRAMRLLIGTRLPGNVRQLRQIIDRAHNRCNGQLIEVHDLPDLEREAALSQEQPPPPADRQELERLRATLDRCQGNVSQAARELGIHRTTLWRRLRRLGLR